MGIALQSFPLKTPQALFASATNVRWGYWCAAVMIAPAAAITTLYPMSWVLGTVSFNPNFVDVSWLKVFMIIPLLIGAFVAQANKSWLLGVMLIPGLLLMLAAPDHLGAIRKADLTQIDFYPENYDGAKLSAEIAKLDQGVADASWLFSVIPPQIPSTEKLKSLNQTASEAQTFWKNALGVETAVAGVQAQIAQISAENQRLREHAHCERRGLAIYTWCYVQTEQKVSANNAQLASLNQQLISMQSAPTPESRYPIAVAAAASAKVEFQALQRLILEKQASIEALPYVLASSLSFIALIYVAGFRSSTLVVLLLATTALGVVSNLPISLDDQIVDAILVLYPTFVCLACAFTLRFYYRAYLDNRIVREKFPRERILNSVFITALLWLPFPMVVAGILVFNQWIYTGISDIVYCNVKVVCGLEKASFPVYDSDPSRDTLRDDVNAAIGRQFARFEAEALQSAAAAKGGTPDVVNSAIAKIMETYSRILPPNIYEIFPNLTPPRMSECIGWLYLHPSCFAKKIAYEKLNDAYRGPRNRLEQRLFAKVTEIGKQVTGAVENAADLLQAGVKGESEAAAAYASKAVDATFLGFNVASVSQMVVMLAVVMRAYLLALGRVLYRSPGRLFKKKVVTPYLTLGHSVPISSYSEDQIREYDDKCKVAYAHTPLLVKRAYSAADAKQSTLMWKSIATRWHLRRLRNKCLFLRRVEANSPSKRLSFSSGEGRSYVAWTIPPGTKVFFDWAKFVAMSEQLELGKEITLRIGGLTLGTTMHASVTARDKEGVLILESGGATFFHEQADPTVDSPFRLMAWRDDAAFKIVSPIYLGNMYLDGPSLDPQPKLARGALNPGTKIPTIGIIRELCMLLRP